MSMTPSSPAERGWTKGKWKFIDATKRSDMQFRPMHVIKIGAKQIASSSWHCDSPSFPTQAECEANMRLMAAAKEMAKALGPFARAAEIYSDTIRNFSVSGETEAERRFSEGERQDAAMERVWEYLTSLPDKPWLEARAALQSATPAGEG